MDPIFAPEIQRLFGFRDMDGFNALFEYLLRRSGGEFEVTLTRWCGDLEVRVYTPAELNEASLAA
jgi:uncharacterized protein YceH (UPF0502 family)